MSEQLIHHLGYLGIVLLLILGGLGLPIPEEAPIILAAVLSKKQTMWWPLALSSCFVGVLVGDFVVYFLGFFYGEKVLSLRMTRKFLTREREAQLKGYFHRHGFKILILGRFMVGFRTAAYLTAGILRLPALKLFLTDLFAASLSTLMVFALGWIFALQIETGLRKAQHWVTTILVAAVALGLIYRFYRGRKRAGLPVGPPVAVGDEVPLPPDDLAAAAHPQADRLPLPEAPEAPATVSALANPEASEPIVAVADPAEPAPPHVPAHLALSDPATADDRDAGR